MFPLVTALSILKSIFAQIKINVDLDCCLFSVELKSLAYWKSWVWRISESTAVWACDAASVASLWIVFGFLPLGGAEDCHRLQGWNKFLSSISEDSGLNDEFWDTVCPSCLAHAWISVFQWIKCLNNQVLWLCFPEELHPGLNMKCILEKQGKELKGLRKRRERNLHRQIVTG